MTLDETKFSRITVTDDEDDVVIHAGVRTQSEPEAAPVDAPSQDAESEEDPDATREGASSAAGPETAPAAERAYRETTSEDLEADPMSLTQKAVIVLAALGVVVLVVYFTFMR